MVTNPSSITDQNLSVVHRLMIFLNIIWLCSQPPKYLYSFLLMRLARLFPYPFSPGCSALDHLTDPIDLRLFIDPVVLPTSGRTVSKHTIVNNNWRGRLSWPLGSYGVAGLGEVLAGQKIAWKTCPQTSYDMYFSG